MSKRSLRDYLSDAFFARDKASFAAVVKDAEASGIKVKDADKDKDEDADKDEKGDGDGTHIHLHMGDDGNPFAKKDDDDKEETKDTALSKRVGKLEDGMKAIDAKLTKIADAVSAKTKDADNPFEKKDDDEGDDDKEKTEDAEAPEGETGALSATALTEAEPELMNADPSLKTGPMQMGDAVYVQKVNKALRLLVQDIKARAEILSPGIKLTMDAKPGKATQVALCNARRDALTKAVGSKAGRAAVGSFTADDIKGMSCAMARTLFVDASTRMAATNNAGGGASGGYVGDDVFVAHTTQVDRLKAINKANADYWAKQQGNPRLN